MMRQRHTRGGWLRRVGEKRALKPARRVVAEKLRSPVRGSCGVDEVDGGGGSKVRMGGSVTFEGRGIGDGPRLLLGW